MAFEIVILILCVILTGVSVWFIVSKLYENKIIELRTENIELKSKIGINESIINTVKTEFSKIAQDSLKSQQEQLLSIHTADLQNRIDVFKAEEISPINRLLKEFKESIDNYQKTHSTDTLEIKNAISTAEKYAKALTSNQNSKGEFGEELLERILEFANLEENIHYSKQYTAEGVKPDFLINLPDNHYLIIDSKVILKNYVEYRRTDDENMKKIFISDLNTCINSLAKKNYEDIANLNQPGFILMYIPIEPCVNMIYTDYDFKNIVENANSKNIIIIGSASLLVALRLVNQLWASKVQNENIRQIIKTGENLYNNIARHAQNLLNIQKLVDDAASGIHTEINRFTTKNNGSIFKEAEKLHDLGINSKSSKSGKKLIDNSIPQEFLADNNDISIEEKI